MKLSAMIIATFLAASTATAAFAQDVPAPPDLARESQYLTNTVSVVLAGELAEVSAFMEENPLTDFLEPSGRIPRIVDVTVLEGTWGDPGAVRRVDLEGDAYVHERVLTSDADEFTYQIWDIATGSGRFINHIYGEIRLSEDAGGTRITWSYNVKPRIFFARPAIRAYLRDDFSPFMTNGLQGLAGAYAGAQL